MRLKQEIVLGMNGVRALSALGLRPSVWHINEYCRDAGIAPAQLFMLGSMAGGSDFNMTALAVRGSRSCNAVSRIHASVTSRTLQELWPQIPSAENPIGYVTNAVHVPTFLAPEWADAFRRRVGTDWCERLSWRTDAAHLLELPESLTHRHLVG